MVNLKFWGGWPTGGLSIVTTNTTNYTRARLLVPNGMNGMKINAMNVVTLSGTQQPLVLCTKSGTETALPDAVYRIYTFTPGASPDFEVVGRNFVPAGTDELMLVLYGQNAGAWSALVTFDIDFE